MVYHVIYTGPERWAVKRHGAERAALAAASDVAALVAARRIKQAVKIYVHAADGTVAWVEERDDDGRWGRTNEEEK